MTRLYTCESIRRIEQHAFAALPDGTLMSRAATAIADQAELMMREIPVGAASRETADEARRESPGVLVLAGPGNNGADALLAGLLLDQRGYRVAALVPSRAAEAGKSHAALNNKILNEYDRLELATRPHSEGELMLPDAALIIDGLLGIGQSRPLTDAMAALVKQVNQAGVAVLSVDVPTGLDVNTGSIAGGRQGTALQAQRTITLLCDKPGLHTGSGKELAGRVIVDRLGFEDQTPADGELFDSAQASALLPRRTVNSHKGSFGSVLIIGGAQGMQGAALLAATGAQAGGAGKVFISSPQQAIFVVEQPQWMSRPWPPDLRDIDAIAIGCGLGKSDTARRALADCWKSNLPLVLDADALNLLAETPPDPASRPTQAPTVATPHPLEAARLLGCTTADVQADRVTAAKTLALRLGGVVILKGAGSIVAASDGRWSINSSGAPTLAVAGTGDVLAGLVAALLAQGLSGWDAARLAAYCHGLAGEMIQDRLPFGSGMAATELFHPIRQVLNGQ